MYVCICHGLKEHDVHAARSSGASDAQTVFSSLGVQPQCGRCLDHMEGMLCDHGCKSPGGKSGGCDRNRGH